MNANELITRVINTLDQITVSGAANMDKLLGCILALRKLVEATANAQAETLSPANAQPEDSRPDNAQPDGITIEPLDE